MSPILKFFAAVQRFLDRVASWLVSPFLLIIRLYWGWQFFVSGKPKFENTDFFVTKFQEWGIPFPALNVYLSGAAECVCGLLLLLGLFSRPAALVLIFVMAVAYVTADLDVVKGIFSNPDGFLEAAPFLFLLASLIVFIFGPGKLSVDELIKVVKRRRKQPEPA